jgi:murein L,D-transpeptidase YafK
MIAGIARAGFLVAALALAGCNDATFEDIAPKAEKHIAPELIKKMQAKGVKQSSPIMVRIFKEEGVLEVWKQKDNGRYDMLASYDICKWSGKLGPKYTEGDRQAPEGFYNVTPGQMNPRSSYHLSFNIGFPNAYDRVNGRSGLHLMVHGACSSAGCYSMTDAQVEQIYALAREAFRGGQTAFQIQAFPFRMTPANMARYKGDQNFAFWQMLKEGYDHFEITKVPPKVDVCDKRYVFNQISQDGKPFSPAAACPATIQPDTLAMAYRGYKSTYEAAFTAAIGKSSDLTPKPSIAGLKEAKLVADWSRRRARGEKVTREPPSLEQPAILAAAPAPKPALPAAVAAPVPAPMPAAVAAETSAPVPQLEAGSVQAATVEAVAPAEAAPEKPGLRKRLLGMFGS